MFNGTITCNDLVVEWEDCSDNDEGFYWRITDFGPHETIAEQADAMRAAHDRIDRLVAIEFAAACQDFNDHMDICAYEDRRAWRAA